MKVAVSNMQTLKAVGGVVYPLSFSLEADLADHHPDQFFIQSLTYSYECFDIGSPDFEVFSNIFFK